MQVPTYERQVTPSAQINPNIISGQPVFQAAQQLNENVQGLNQQVQQRRLEIQQQKDTQKVLDTHTQMLKEWNDGLYSQEVDKDGKPKGFLQQNLNNADGVTSRFNVWAEGIKEKYSGMLQGENEQKAFDQLFKNAYESTEGVVVKHEADQFQASQDKTDEDNFNQQVNDAGLNPDLIATIIPQTQAITQIRGQQKGLDQKSIDVAKQGRTDQLVASAINSCLNNEDYEKAQMIYDQSKSSISNDMSIKVKDAILKVKNNVEFDKTADDLVSKFSYDTAKAHKEIDGMKLSIDEKNQLTRTYDTSFSQWRQDKANEINSLVNKYYPNVEKAGNGIAAFKYVRGLPQGTKDEFEIKQAMFSIASELYPEYNSDGTLKSKEKPEAAFGAWFNAWNDIQNGKIITQGELIKNYAGLISINDMKGFLKLLDTVAEKDKKGLVGEVSAKATEAKIKDPLEQGKFLDFINQKIQIFRDKNGRLPSSEERTNILNDAATDVITGRKVGSWYTLGIVKNANEKTKRYEIPPGFVYSEKLKAWIGKDKNGNMVKYVPD